MHVRVQQMRTTDVPCVQGRGCSVPLVGLVGGVVGGCFNLRFVASSHPTTHPPSHSLTPPTHRRHARTGTGTCAHTHRHTHAPLALQVVHVRPGVHAPPGRPRGGCMGAVHAHGALRRPPAQVEVLGGLARRLQLAAAFRPGAAQRSSTSRQQPRKVPERPPPPGTRGAGEVTVR